MELIGPFSESYGKVPLYWSYDFLRLITFDIQLN